MKWYIKLLPRKIRNRMAIRMIERWKREDEAEVEAIGDDWVGNRVAEICFRTGRTVTMSLGDPIEPQKEYEI